GSALARARFRATQDHPHTLTPQALALTGEAHRAVRVYDAVTGHGAVLTLEHHIPHRARRSGPAGDERDKAIRRHASRGDGADHGVHAIAPGRYRRALHGGAV